MSKLLKTVRWLLAALTLFGAFVVAAFLRDSEVSPRDYVAAAGMSGILMLLNTLPRTWPARRRFVLRFGFVFVSMPAASAWFGDPFTWGYYVFAPLAIASGMAAAFHLADSERGQAAKQSGQKAA